MLTLLVLLVAALMVLGLVGAVLRGAGVMVAAGCLAVSAGFAVVALLALAAGGGSALALAMGPPGAALTLALDALSAWFLLLLGLAGMAASLFAMADAAQAAPRVVAGFPLFLAAMAVTLLAADGLTLLLGFEAMSLASWVLVAHNHADAANRRAARLYLSFALGAGVMLAAALALWAAGGGVGFAALRAAPPEGWRAAAILGLVLAGAGSKAGLVPLHAWLPLAHPVAPGHVSALMSAAMVKVAVYVIARLLLDCAGPAQPLWWGVPLIAAGVASAVLGALRAALEEDTKVILACSTVENVGLIVAAFGLAAVLRAADLGALSALAMGAGLLHALGHAVFKCGLFLAAAAVLHGAGSRRIDSLGGLIHAMPVTAATALVMAAAAAALPPLAGFSGEWLLLQSLLAGWRVGPLPMQVALAATVALVGLAAALAAAAMVRFWGLVFLGRPRGPRSAAALEAPPLARAALVGCAAASLAFGLIPGPLLALADGAVRQAVRHGPGAQAGWFGLWPGDGATAYAAPGIALLLAVVGAGIAWAVARRSPAGHVVGPAWGCGFLPAGPDLPFGDPLAQPSAAGFGQPLRRMLGTTLLSAREQVTMPEPGDPAAARIDAGFADPSFARLLVPLAQARDSLAETADRLRDMTLRQCLSLTFGAVVALLALVAWLESGA